MSNELIAWLDGAPIGTFHRGRRIEFTYADEGQDQILSLSLPRGRKHQNKAAEKWLDGLLPEREAEKAALAAKFGTDTDAFSLLSHIGDDTAGAVSLLPPGREPGDREDVSVLVGEPEIAQAIASIQRGAPTAQPKASIKTFGPSSPEPTTSTQIVRSAR